VYQRQLSHEHEGKARTPVTGRRSPGCGGGEVAANLLPTTATGTYSGKPECWRPRPLHMKRKAAVAMSPAPPHPKKWPVKGAHRSVFMGGEPNVGCCKALSCAAALLDESSSAWSTLFAGSGDWEGFPAQRRGTTGYAKKCVTQSGRRTPTYQASRAPPCSATP
jgi:hypothetical protein